MRQALDRLPQESLALPEGHGILAAYTVAEYDGSGVSDTTVEKWAQLKAAAAKHDLAQVFDALLALSRAHNYAMLRHLHRYFRLSRALPARNRQVSEA